MANKYTHDAAKIRKFYGVLAGAKMQRRKDDLVASFGSDNAVSINDLMPAQLDRLITWLDEQQDRSDYRQQISRNLRLLTELGIYKDPNPWPAVNRFVSDKRLGGKRMNQMSVAELKKLTKKLHAIKRKQAATRKLDGDIESILNAIVDELENDKR